MISDITNTDWAFAELPEAEQIAIRRQLEEIPENYLRFLREGVRE